MSPIAEGIQQLENEIILARKSVQKWLCNFSTSTRSGHQLNFIVLAFRKE